MSAYNRMASDPFSGGGSNPIQSGQDAAFQQQLQQQQAANQATAAKGLGQGVATYSNGTQNSPVTTPGIPGDSGGLGHAIAIGMGINKGYDSALAGQNVTTFANTLAGLGAQSNTMANSNIAQAQALGAQNYMQGAQNAYQTQVQNYGQQQGAATMLYNQATGQTASPADMQMQSGLANANNQAQSAAYSQQGGVSPGLTQRNLLNSQAQQNASIVNQGAQMRAQETQAAQQNYGTMLNNMGQTAAGMQQSQFNMGNFQYGQGQNALHDKNQYEQQNLGFQQGNAVNLYGAVNNQVNTRAGYNAQQGITAMNTLGAAANAGATAFNQKS